MSANAIPRYVKEPLVSAHAQVIGPVEIGAKAKVGAGAVVVSDVPSDVTVVGVLPRSCGCTVEKTNRLFTKKKKTGILHEQAGACQGSQPSVFELVRRSLRDSINQYIE